MTIEIGLFIAMVSCATSALGFLANRLANAARDGKREGTMLTEMSHIKEGVSRVERGLEKSQETAREDLKSIRLAFEVEMRKQREDHTDGLRRAHDRIDVLEGRIGQGLAMR